MITADRYAALVAAYEDGSLDDAGRRALTRALAEDPALREEFLDCYEVHLQLAAHLRLGQGPALAERVRQVADGSTQTSRFRIADGAITRERRRRRRRGAVLWAAAALVLVALGAGVWSWSGVVDGAAGSQPTPIAGGAPQRLVVAADAQRAVRLAAGTMTVTGPAAVTIADTGVAIAAGSCAIVIDRPLSVSPMRFTTPQATVVVTGTRLTIACHDEGTRVAVSEGRVRFIPAADAVCTPPASGEIVAGDEVLALDRAWLDERARALTTGPMAFDRPEVEYEEGAHRTYRDGDWVAVAADAPPTAATDGLCLRRPIAQTGETVRIALPPLPDWEVMLLGGSVWLLLEEGVDGPSPDVAMSLDGWAYDMAVPRARWASSATVGGDQVYRIVQRERGRFGNWYEAVRSQQGVTDDHRLVFGTPEALAFEVAANDGGVILGVRWLRMHTYTR